MILQSPSSRHLGTSHSSPNHHQLPHPIFLNLIHCVKSLPFQRWFSFGRNQKSQGTKSGLYEGSVTWVIWCFAKELCQRDDAWGGTLSCWSCQSLVARSCSLLNFLNSFYEGMFKLNAKLSADWLFYLLSYFWTWRPHSTHAHSTASATPTG